MRGHKLGSWAMAGILAALSGACSAGMSDSATDGTGGSGAAGSSQTGQGGATQSSTQAQFMNGSGGSQQGCNTGPNDDTDMDGWTFAQGDCNDCDENVNPGAIEVVVDPSMGTGGGGGAMPADEDCDGTIDNPPEPCDAGLMLAATDPMDAARSVELCKIAAGGDDWGVVSVQWVRANGVPTTVSDQWGIQAGWGQNVPVRAGDNMLVMSSGKARLPSQPGSCGSLSCYGPGVGQAPPGFPQDVPGCSGDTEINDDVGLEVTLRAPTNATGYQFDFDFYSFEFPEWVCTSYNDQFIALVNPAPVGSINGNISFDSMSNPVSVNIAYFDVCTYDSFYPQFPCTLGPGELQGTGFDTWDDAGATSWLRTTAPIGGGETFSLRWAIWDTGDQAWDSTVLIDNFQWIANGGTVNVGTDPVPE